MIRIISVGNKLPAWVDDGVASFKKRLHEPFSVDLIELPTNKVRNTQTRKLLEGEQILNKLPKGAHIVALDVRGQETSTEQFAQRITCFFNERTLPCFIIGGADGLHDNILKKAHSCWSLSKLTFPHTLAKVILLEQIYRSASIINNHPYHH